MEIPHQQTVWFGVRFRFQPARPAMSVHVECMFGGGHETSGYCVETKVITPRIRRRIYQH